MITQLTLNLNQLQFPNFNSKIKSLSSSKFSMGHISSQSAVFPVGAALANSKSRLKLGYNCMISSKKGYMGYNHRRISSSLSSIESCMISEPVVVVPIAAQPKVVAIARFDSLPIAPVVLPIPAIDAFPEQISICPEEHLTLHNKLMLLPQQLFLKEPTNNNHPANLYRHSFCFVGHGSYLLAGCCHNLILVCFYGTDRSCPREALWNLITNELKFLPEPDFPRSVSYHYNVTYTFIKSYGFGFDPLSKDYKVLRFVQFDYEDGYNSYASETMEIYSLKTDSWKRVVINSNLGHFIPFRVPSVLINGFYYWRAEVEQSCCWGHSYIILSFDFATEKFSHIPQLSLHCDTNVYDFYELVEFEGLLAALFHSKLGSCGGGEPFTFEIWVWSGNEWSRRVPAIDVPATNIATVVGLFDNEKLFLQNTEKELLLFDCATRELENLGVYADPRRLWFHRQK